MAKKDRDRINKIFKKYIKESVQEALFDSGFLPDEVFFDFQNQLVESLINNKEIGIDFTIKNKNPKCEILLWIESVKYQEVRSDLKDLIINELEAHVYWSEVSEKRAINPTLIKYFIDLGEEIKSRYAEEVKRFDPTIHNED